MNRRSITMYFELICLPFLFFGILIFLPAFYNVSLSNKELLVCITIMMLTMAMVIHILFLSVRNNIAVNTIKDLKENIVYTKYDAMRTGDCRLLLELGLLNQKKQSTYVLDLGIILYIDHKFHSTIDYKKIPDVFSIYRIEKENGKYKTICIQSLSTS